MANMSMTSWRQRTGRFASRGVAMSWLPLMMYVAQSLKSYRRSLFFPQAAPSLASKTQSKEATCLPFRVRTSSRLYRRSRSLRKFEPSRSPIFQARI
jgi:hypothetical protein